MKILITGCLGYIGTEVIEVLGSSNELIGVDIRADESAVSWAKANHVEYHARDIFDIADLLADCDVCVHLAGLTAVPGVASQENPEIAGLIHKYGTEATRYLIASCPQNCRIIFASTHVCWEGLPANSPEVTEEVGLCPVLSYSRSKAQSEQDLKASGKPHAVLRLASVFGYNKNIRVKILPNLFSKMSALGETLKVHGDGSNLKPMVGIRDVARFVQFEIENATNQTYNLVSVHRTVAEVARICQTFTDCPVVFTDDEVPNAGYRLSNAKILAAGFRFEQILEDEIGKMIAVFRA